MGIFNFFQDLEDKVYGKLGKWFSEKREKTKAFKALYDTNSSIKIALVGIYYTLSVRYEFTYKDINPENLAAAVANRLLFIEPTEEAAIKYNQEHNETILTEMYKLKDDKKIKEIASLAYEARLVIGERQSVDLIPFVEHKLEMIDKGLFNEETVLPNGTELKAMMQEYQDAASEKYNEHFGNKK